MMKNCVFFIALLCASKCSAGFQSGNKLDEESVPFDPELQSDEYGHTDPDYPGLMWRLQKRGFEECSRFATQVVSDKTQKLIQSIPEMKFDVDFIGTWTVTVRDIKIDDFAMPSGIVMSPMKNEGTEDLFNLRCDALSISGSASIHIQAPNWFPNVDGKVFLKTSKAALNMSFFFVKNANTTQPLSIDILSGPCSSSLGNWDITFDFDGFGGTILENVLVIANSIVRSRIEDFVKPQICEKLPGFVKSLVNNNLARLPLSISSNDLLAKMGITRYDGPPHTSILYFMKCKASVLFNLVMSIDFSVRNDTYYDDYDRVGQLDVEIYTVIRVDAVDTGFKVVKAFTIEFKLTEVDIGTGTGLNYTEKYLHSLETFAQPMFNKLLEEHLLNKHIDIPLSLAEDYVDLQATSFDIAEHGLQISADFRIKPIVATRYDEMENNTQQRFWHLTKYNS
ncbi:hypothetical protein DdX_13606 [Ditylenchus destructor]|uniref:Lipid-binding serum glycoprotein C-terminal domain-containing protein n=1 Tax=Ditylenchus destructor TaxID=166010 RepID=A0AAD4MTP3_9BILA|nr:hypothetical protein DdX_13606 [Ditylenchus destructor]